MKYSLTAILKTMLRHAEIFGNMRDEVMDRARWYCQDGMLDEERLPLVMDSGYLATLLLNYLRSHKELVAMIPVQPPRWGCEVVNSTHVVLYIRHLPYSVYYKSQGVCLLADRDAMPPPDFEGRSDEAAWSQMVADWTSARLPQSPNLAGCPR